MVKAVKLTMNEIPVVKDWGDVSEVELYDPLLTPEMKDFVNEAKQAWYYYPCNE